MEREITAASVRKLSRHDLEVLVVTLALELTREHKRGYDARQAELDRQMNVNT